MDVSVNLLSRDLGGVTSLAARGLHNCLLVLSRESGNISYRGYIRIIFPCSPLRTVNEHRPEFQDVGSYRKG